MKKFIIILICLLLFVSVVTAAGPKGTPGGPAGNLSSEQAPPAPGLLMTEQQQIPGSGTGIQQNPSQNIQQQVHLTGVDTPAVQTELGLHQRLQVYQQELNQSLLQAPAGQQNILKNQNSVRLAVHTFLAAGNMTGGIGPQIAQIAQRFNNSVQATIQAEENIQARSGLSRFFFGGDQGNADAILSEVGQNQLRITEMQQLLLNCAECDNETRDLLREQLQNIELEQTRLRSLAENESADRGIFGFLSR